MVDFTKKIFNSNKFNEAARFFKEHGCYTLAPRGTTDYNNYWDRETDRCLNGFVADDGDAITGYHYFYLNYFPILRLVDEEYVDREGVTRKRRVRKTEFADFYDYDYYYFNAVEEAERTGKHMAVLKARNKGYSFKGASMLVRNYELIPGSQNFAVASEQGFLTNDGLLTKAWDGMDFVDKYTDWSKQRLVDTKMKRTSGFKITDEFGKQTEQGYKSSIIGITLKNNPDRIRGTRGRLILWEEAGKFRDILQAWQVARPSVEEAGVAFGMQIAYGTGGSDDADFTGLKEMFYHPDGYNILAFDNIWDEKAENTKCAFFVPSWTNLSAMDENSNRIFMDKDGNSLVEKSIQFQIDERNKVKEGASEQVTVDRYVAENCLTPQESILEIGANIFPKKLLMQQLSRIRTSEKLKHMKHIVDLAWDGNGMVKATEKKTGDIVDYPLPKDKKPDGSVVIWEYPVKDPPFGLYIAGCLTPGEKVWTQRGLVNVEDVDLGDKLVNKDGKLVEIRNLQRYKKINEIVYRLKPAGSYRSTEFTGEHPIWVRDKGFVKMKDVSVSDVLELPNRYYNNIVGGSDKEKKFFYFLGLWLGDGFTNINGKSYDIYMSIGKDEKPLAEFYDSIITELFGRKCIHVHKQKEQTRRFTNKDLVNFLDEQFGRTAYRKRVPEWVKYAPVDYKYSFIQGYLDSDGCVLRDRNSIRANFTSVNLELLEDIQDILYSLGIRNSIVIHQKRTINKALSKLYGKDSISLQSYRINIAGCDVCKLRTGRIYESRKQKLLNNARIDISPIKSKTDFSADMSKIYLKIDSIIQRNYSGVVYNFECNTHTYMTRNILTHNCDPLTDRRV